MSAVAALLTPQFLRFLVAGGVAATANYGSRFFFSRFVPFEVAIVLAYLLGMVIAFVLMRRQVFDAHDGPVLPQAMKFAIVNVVAILQMMAVSIVLARWVLPAWGIVEHAEALGHLVGVLVPAISSYFGHKLLTFR